MSGEKRPGLKHIELQQDLQQVQSQENPLRVGDQRVLLIQTNEDGIHQDDEVEHYHKAPKDETSINMSELSVCEKRLKLLNNLPMLDNFANEAAGGRLVEVGE